MSGIDHSAHQSSPSESSSSSSLAPSSAAYYLVVENTLVEYTYNPYTGVIIINFARNIDNLLGL
jgi:hypothetical protein